MSASRSGTFDTSMSRPTLALRGHLGRARGQPRRAQVLERHEQRRASSSSRQHSISFFSSNGSPICTLGRLESSPSDELGAGQHATRRRCRRARCARPSARAGCPTPGRGAADQPSRAREAHAHRVHEAVLLVGRLEVAPRRPRSARRSSCRSGRCPATDQSKQVARALRSRARRSAASRAPRSAARRSRTRRAGCRPTPVAAPWNGSTALGWLCDSTLNATASPSPTSTAPAFSPGPITTCGPSVGSRRSSFFECL